VSSQNQSRQIAHPPPEDIFDSAVERLTAGESLGSILASVPKNLHDEISDMLTIVEFTQQMQSMPVPVPARPARTSRKADFLAAARAVSGPELAPVSPVPTGTVHVGQPTFTRPQTTRPQAAQLRTPVPPRPPISQPSFFQRFAEGLNNLFTIRTLRFAPLLLLLGILFIGTPTVYTIAQASIPGDFTYPIKQWVRNRSLQNATVAEQQEMLKRHGVEVAEEIRKATAKADESNTEIEATEILLYQGMEGRRHAIGELLVSPWFQSSDADQFSPMDIIGQLAALTPGTQVRLEYRILPGQDAEENKPLIQGVTLEVIATPEASIAIVPDTPMPPSTPLPTEINTPDETIMPTPDVLDGGIVSGDGVLPPASDLQPTSTSGVAITIAVVPPTATPLPSPTLISPSPTPTIVSELTVISSPPPCQVSSQEGWIPYQVNRGDTLSQMAQRGGTTVSQLKAVNCLTTDTIIAGEELSVPASSIVASNSSANSETVNIETVPPTATPLFSTNTSTVIPPTLTNTPLPSSTQALPTPVPTATPGADDSPDDSPDNCPYNDTKYITNSYCYIGGSI